jgi:hypothetical protein
MRITFATLVANLSGGARVIHTYAKALKERGHPPRLSASPTFHEPASYDASEVPDADVVIATWWESRMGREISAVHPEQSHTLKRNGDAQ